MSDYEFTEDWFGGRRFIWDQLMPQMNPSRILEIGSFEGRSTCYLIEELSKERPLEIHCIDTFKGGLEHQAGETKAEMDAVETRFSHNVQVALERCVHKVDIYVHKGYSDAELPKLLVNGKQAYFDFIYVDGSHQAPDVLLDALLSFKLLRVGGLIGFDDYLWFDPLAPDDILRSPKLAVDVFTNVYRKKIKLVDSPNYQFYVQKVSE